MRVINLDGRHAHGKKYAHAIQFKDTGKRTNYELYRYSNIFEKLYGASFTVNPEFRVDMHNWRHKYIENELWLMDKKHHRICFRDKSMLTMVLLKVNPGK